MHTNPPSDASSCQAIPINSWLKRRFLSSFPPLSLKASSLPVPCLIYAGPHIPEDPRVFPLASQKCLCQDVLQSSLLSWQIPALITASAINYYLSGLQPKPRQGVCRSAGGTALAAEGAG